MTTMSAPQAGPSSFPPSPIHIYLSSKDVIHDFFLPNFRVKLDAVPGMKGLIPFTIRKEAISTQPYSIHELPGDAPVWIDGDISIAVLPGPGSEYRIKDPKDKKHRALLNMHEDLNFAAKRRIIWRSTLGKFEKIDGSDIVLTVGSKHVHVPTSAKTAYVKEGQPIPPDKLLPGDNLLALVGADDPNVRQAVVLSNPTQSNILPGDIPASMIPAELTHLRLDLAEAGVDTVKAIIHPYEVVCEQLCGAGHEKMRGEMIVLSAADYEKFNNRYYTPPATQPVAAASPDK